MRNARFLVGITGIALLGMTVAGCKKEEPAPPSPEQQVEINAKLAAADAYDGSPDKVVGKCAVCRLGMDGTADHVIKAHGYTLRFCKAGCKTKFGKDVDKSILTLKVPE